VLEASREARRTGVGKKLEYRIKHKNGQWRVLESTASTIKDGNGEVEKLVIINRDVTDRKLAEEALERNSFHDALTSLPNRRLFLDRLQRSFARAKRSPEYRYAILFVDVDNFKALNETIGEATGDFVIQEIGRRLATCLRSDDTVARPKGNMPTTDMLSRMGGDEFTILLENIDDSSDAMRAAERIQRAVAEPLFAEGRELRATVSIGIALSLTEHRRAEDYLEDAETAMRRAKSCGGSRCEVFDESLHRRAINRLTLETELQTAFRHHQFELHYQPIVRLKTREIVGFEALLRWRHPEKGVLPAAKFLEVVENNGLIVSIGNWAVREGCRQLQARQSANPALDRLCITVNVSALQLAHANFLADTKSAIQETHIEPADLQLEIMERDAMADSKQTLEICSQLKRLGVRISIGDFGKGLFSLSTLRRLPLDELKIDRALVSRMPLEIVHCDIVRLMIPLANSLKLRLIAAGIDTDAHMNLLTAMGCEFGQGALFSPPVDAKQAEQLLRRTGQDKHQPGVFSR